MEVDNIELDNKNDLFNLAVEFVRSTNKNLFLTGKAGTGKTTFLKYIRQTIEKKMVVLAPTGVAAINAGGTTLSNFGNCKIGIRHASRIDSSYAGYVHY